MNVRSCYYRELSIVISVPPRAPSPGVLTFSASDFNRRAVRATTLEVRRVKKHYLTNHATTSSTTPTHHLCNHIHFYVQTPLLSYALCSFGEGDGDDEWIMDLYSLHAWMMDPFWRRCNNKWLTLRQTLKQRGRGARMWKWIELRSALSIGTDRTHPHRRRQWQLWRASDETMHKALPMPG